MPRKISEDIENTDNSIVKPRHGRGKSVLYRYIVLYFIVLSIIIVFSVPIYRTAIKVVDREARHDCELILDTGAERFTMSLETVMNINNSIPPGDFLMLRSLTDERFTSQDIYSLINVRRQLASCASSIEGVKELFILFHNNSKVISLNSIYMDRNEFFGKFMVYRGKTGAEMSSLVISRSETQGFLPQSPIKNAYLDNVAEVDCLTFVTRPNRGTATFCALYPMSKLEKLFGFENLPEDSYITVTDYSGSVLTSYGAAGTERFSVYTYDIPVAKAKISVSIPDDYFIEEAAPLKRIIFTYIIVMLLVGVFMVLVLSFYTYRPIYRLVKESRGDYTMRNSIDEFDFLRRVSAELTISNNELRSSLRETGRCLRSSTLLNAMLGGAYEAAIRSDNMFDRPSRLAIINTDTSGLTAESLMPMLDSDDITVVRINSNCLAALFESEKNAEFDRLISPYENLRVVVSEVFTGAVNVRRVFLQTQAYAPDAPGTLRYLEPRDSSETTPSDEAIAPVINSLNAAIKRNNLSEVERIFEVITQAVATAGEDIETIKSFYYALRSVPAMLVYEQRRERDVFLPIYDDLRPAAEQFSRLGDICLELSGSTKKSVSAKSYKESLVTYIEENFQNPDLYAGLIADKFSISTKQVGRIVKDFTGYGFSEYLEHLRMEKALELLTNTGESVANIAAKCGFNSANTFYKAFKKVFGVAPGQYRK